MNDNIDLILSQRRGGKITINPFLLQSVLKLKSETIVIYKDYKREKITISVRESIRQVKKKTKIAIDNRQLNFFEE